MIKRKHPLAECEKCPLSTKPCARTSFPKTPQAKAAIVSRSPGKYEARSGVPFSGPSGKVLNHLLRMNGVSRDEILATNVVLCTPDGGKVPPEAIKACSGRLRSELDGIPLVIAAGSEAVNLLIGRGTIDRFRGYRIVRDGRTIVATNNPALVLRDDSTFPNLKNDFKRAFNPNPTVPFPKVEVIEGVDDAKRYLTERIGDTEHSFVASDIESRGGLSHRATLISMQFAIEGTHAVVLGEREGIFQDRDLLDNYLRPFLESRSHQFVWHNGKFDVKVLRHTYGIEARVDEDTLLMHYALDERSGSDDAIGIHGLEYLLMEEFGWPKYTNPRIERAKKTGVVEDYDEFYEYAGRDAGGCKSLHELYLPLATDDDVLKPYHELLIAGINDLAIPAELRGMVYDVDRAADLYEFSVKPEMEELIEQMRTQIGNEILKPTSPTQMAKIYYDEWGLKHSMRNRPDKERSVDESARKEILADRFTFKGSMTTKRVGTKVVAATSEDAEEKREHIKQFVQKHHRFSKIQKQASTFIMSLIERAELDPEHRVYTELLFHGTNSGRLSSRRPNLQNITRPAEDLPNIRNLFKASPGRQIVNADFSQAELRCIACFSHDELLWGIYERGEDLHSECAKRFFGENFTKANRDISKNVNFGVFYRQSAATFQEKHGIPEKEAQPYIDWVWKTFTGVAAWEKTVEAEIHTKGVLVSPFGRKRRFHLITDFNKQAAYREGINFYPQSTANDLTLSSAIIIAGEIDSSRANIVLTVHDSIVGDVEDNYIEEFSTISKEVMESRAKDRLGWTLPFLAEVQVGPTWGEVK